ncbi:MAG: DUF3160 domain-containing protein [Butyrivibrio sp.]|uniref:DUF3160 domain-containing protein n=1 Tax=Butyrivibrio sp. TaxID=28121 RepID=UPI0025B93517|nr:DUF3160 domain-containing protein [Butyrivibrio sp.]MBQ6589285.1 DUF3160 domain-containing protein [Butyrivibrio sp.]
MKKKVLVIVLSLAMLTACGKAGSVSTEQPQNATNDASQTVTSEEKTDVSEKESAETQVVPLSSKASILGDEEIIYYDPNLVPSIPSYTVEPDLSNVVIHPSLDYTFNMEHEDEYNKPKERIELLSKNGFVITGSAGDEFFDVYEGNRYGMVPNFITVDSLMHTYHLYFAYLMKNSEKDYLSEELKSLSLTMYETSKTQYEELKGSQWEKAALDNLIFFYIGSKLLDDSVALPDISSDVTAAVDNEMQKIKAAEGIDFCVVTDKREDYSQYKVRGYYEGDEKLERYFRAMMWYGRIAFELENEEMVKSAILQTSAISPVQDKWNSIYKITSFFAGSSDDPGYIELSEIISDVYGQLPDTQTLTSDEASFKAVLEKVKDLKMPEINSIPVEDGDNPIIPSYRFMGQRFTIDAAIMQRLIYSSVKENSKGEFRYLPDALDTPAALGSEAAMKILEEKGATDYKNYTDNMTIVSQRFNNDDPQFWNASLYAGWLNTLRPLLEEKGEGYPSYMQNSEWTKKNLETFAGSYTELKHDTVLYAKQNMAEMGGGEEDLDDRGYVDPQPVVYSRFKFLSEKTKEGLEGYGMLSASSKEDLDRLSEIAGTLLAISEKELRYEDLSDDDYEFIRSYGGYIEHFWREANKEENGESPVSSDQAPGSVVVDIATDPNGTVLEIATGHVDGIYVVFPIDGELHIAHGGVYSFYQFEQNMNDRLTDTQWRTMLSGGYLDDDWNWVAVENNIDRADWTKSYRTERW